MDGNGIKAPPSLILIYILQYHFYGYKPSKYGRFTSSTAQGGGGSFKNRKPIGGVGCCESRMAERSHWWTDRSLRSLLFLSLSIFFPDYLPTYPPIYVCIIHLSLSLSVCVCVCLSIYLSISLSLSRLSVSLSLCLSVSLSLCLSVSLSVCLSVYLSVCLSVCLSASLKTKRFCETASVFKLDNIKNAIQRDFLNFCTWQHQKRSNSARLPHFLSWQHQKRSNSARHPSKMESWVQNWRPRTNAFCDFSSPSICLNYCAHEKVMPGHTRCCTCHSKWLQQTWRSQAPKCNPSQEISAGPPSSSDEHVSCTAPATENASLQIVFKCPTPAIVFGNATKPSRFAHF